MWETCESHIVFVMSPATMRLTVVTTRVVPVTQYPRARCMKLMCIWRPYSASRLQNDSQMVEWTLAVCLRYLTATEDLQIEGGPGKNIEIGAIFLSEAGIISRLQEHYKHTRIFSHVTPSTDLVDVNI